VVVRIDEVSTLWMVFARELFDTDIFEFWLDRVVDSLKLWIKYML
jgi:hypothetical protein